MESSFYNINFEKEYLQINFDNLLRESNSKLVNNEFYLEPKVKYFEKTKANYDLFKKYKDELDKLIESDIYYIDSEQKIVKTKNILKNIILEQDLVYKNFLNHIKFLQSLQ